MKTYQDLSSITGLPENWAAFDTLGSVRREFGLAWLDSVWFGLTISFIVGLLYTLVLLGPAMLNPRNIGWLRWDPATHFIGWELLRQDPHWHWPLTYTNRVGYPLGENVALMDLYPLLAVLFKLLSPLLPEPFQYFGIAAVLSCALQLFFSARLFRIILGRNPLGIWLCSLFFLVSPVLVWRLNCHLAASNHWLLVAALFVYFQAQQESPRTVRRFVISALLLGAIACATNPYLAFPVVLMMTAAAGSLLWQHRLPLSKAAGFMAALAVTCAIMVYSLGFFPKGGSGFGGYGYPFSSLNMLAPLDPYVYGLTSRLLPHFPRGPGGLGYSGCNYLGAGVIFLTIFLLILFVLQPGKRPPLDKRRLVPLFLCCVVLTLMALSTRVVAGHAILVDVDPQHHLSRFLEPLRASDRLFWAPYYTILTAVLAAPFLLFRKSQASLLLTFILAVQVVDTAPLRNWVHYVVTAPRPEYLKSPIWSRLGSVHENLVVLPAWWCGGPKFSPGGSEGYRIFGLLAVAQKMRTNSYYSGRYTSANREFHCKQSIVALAERPLSFDTAYVVTPALAAAIAAGPTGPGRCHEVDSFILCSTKIDLGVVSGPVPELGDDAPKGLPGKQH